ncbi:hypothetical protein NQ315_015116 [Exocentrus adspersus]|jgi:Ran GTPase-activating protein (RanGAP) involved in mRNA processing and transport
MATE